MTININHLQFLLIAKAIPITIDKKCLEFREEWGKYLYYEHSYSPRVFGSLTLHSNIQYINQMLFKINCEVLK